MVGARSRGGSVAVEFGLVLPILLVLVAGAMSWGHVLAQEVTLVQIARDGALAGGRAAAADGPDAVARARVEEGLAAAGFDVSSSTVTVTRISVPTGAAIQVSVAMPVDVLLDLVPLPDTLNARTTARLEDQ